VDVTLARLNSALPDDGDYTETCWSCFSVNFNANFKLNTEDVDKLTVSYYKPKSNEDFTYLQKESKTPPEDEDEDCKSHPPKTLTVKGMKEAFNHHELFLSMMEKSDRNADGRSKVRRTTDWDAGC